jgi:tetratricopeptide (TPR) repeat protein
MELIIEQALTQLNRKNNKEALSLFDQAISYGFNIPGLNYGMAIALARMGQFSKAFELLKKLLDKLPDHPKAYKLLAELSSFQNDNLISKKKTIEIPKKEQEGSIWLPGTQYPDDVFIVSYPKSGNTWLRFLIANLLKQEEEINFHTVHNYVPEVGRQEEIIENLERPRIMKSHAPYIREYSKVIYLIRDGRDVYVSYYFYKLNQLLSGCTFREFLVRQDHYPCTWGEHVSSWLLRLSPSNLLLVRYEDLIRDCPKQLKRIASYLGLERTENQLSLASEKSSFDNMRRIEHEKGRLYKDLGPKVFMRKGKTGDWTNYFGQDEKTVFKSREGQILIELGYEIDDKW